MSDSTMRLITSQRQAVAAEVAMLSMVIRHLQGRRHGPLRRHPHPLGQHQLLAGLRLACTCSMPILIEISR